MKMNKSIHLLTTALSLLISTAALAAANAPAEAAADLESNRAATYGDDISLGIPAFAGTGCPQGSASAALTPDGKTLSVLFDSYVAEAGGMSMKQVDRKNCTVAIPVHVPQGLSVSILQVDYRGFNSIPSGGMSMFQADYFFAGQRGPSYRKYFTGPVDSDYTLGNTLVASAMVWSPCGRDVNLRINTSMMAKSNYYNDQVLATVDSIDMNAGIVYKLQWRSCNGAIPSDSFGW